MKKMYLEEFRDLCMTALEVLHAEEDLKSLASPVTENAIGKMLYFFESIEDYEACQDIQEIALAIFDRRVEPAIIRYETAESEA
jgi:hypothetical protein